MEIRNFLTRQAAFAYEQPILLKNGETYEATIKEKMNDNEAIVNIKGTDIRVQVEGELPQEGRVMIEVKAQQGDVPVVKVIPRPQPAAKPQTNDITTLLTKLGAGENVPAELKQAAQLLLSKEMPLTKETVAVLKTFFAEAPGTVEQKLDTIRALVNKKLEVTNTQITAVHEALHGKPLGEVLTSIAKQLDASFTFTKQEIEDSGRVTKEVIANVRKEIQREADFAKVMERVAELAKTAETDVSEALNRAVREAAVFHEKGQESFARSKIVQTLVLLEQSVSQEAGVQRGMSEDDLVEQVKKLRDYVQREPLVGKAIAIVKEKMVDNKNISHDVQEKIAATLQEVERLRQIGQPLSAKAKLVQALTQMEDEIAASSKTTEVQSHDGAEQTVQALQKAKDIIRNTNNLPEAIQRLKNEIIGHVDEKTAAEIETFIERLSIAQKAGKDRLIQAFEQIEKELASKQADQTERPFKMAKQQALRTNEVKAQPSQNLAELVKEVRSQVMKESDLTKALVQVRTQLVYNDYVPEEVQQKADQVLKEAQVLKTNGQESLAHRQVVQALTELEQFVEQEKPLVRDVANQVKQVREQVTREPNLTKAVEHVRQHIVDVPEMDREVAEKVNRALREVVQLQRMGREGDARVRLMQALAQAEEALRVNEAKPQPSANLIELVKDVRSQVMKEADLSKALAQVRTQLVHNDNVPEEVRQKVDQVLKEAQVLKTNGQESLAHRQVVQALTELEQSVEQEKPMIIRDVANRVKQVREQAAREPNLTKAVEQVRQHIVDAPEMDQEIAKKVDRALREVVQLQQIGREIEARTSLVQALTQAEQELRIQEPANQVKQVREQAAREPNLSRAVEQVRQHIVDAPEMDREVAEKVNRALREVVQLQRQGREGEARVRLVQALEQVEQELRAQEPANQVKQVREQAAREPNLSKAVEQVRQHIVDAPEMDRKVAEKVNQALREVVQLQRMGREGDARVRLMQALTQAEEALRANEAKPQPSANLIELVKDIRSQVMKEVDLTKALAQVRTQFIHNDYVPVDIQQKMEKAIKDASLLQQIGRETFAKNHLIRTLEQVEKAVAAKEQKPQADLLETIQQIKQTITEAETIEKAIREIRQQLHRFSDNSIVTQLTKAMFEAAKLDKSGREQLLTSLTNLESEHMKDITNEKEISNQHIYDAVRKAIKTLQREANLEKAFDFIKTETMPRLNKEPKLEKKLTDSFTKALQLQESGRELAARQTMLETLAEIEASLPPAANEETDLSTSLNNLFDSEWQTSLQLQTKDIIVQTITKKMSQAAIDFKNIKRDIMRNLETISQLIEKYKQSAQPQAKQLLDTTIKQLDNAILKSDMMLFTDMMTEKQLMKASSQLAEARKRLNKGDYSGAQKIVKEVKDVLAKMQFKPSDVKVKHFVADESLKFAGSPREFLTQMNKTVQPVALEPSARQMFETIRRLGFTHDYEVAESLVFKGNNENTPQQNMKAMLLKLVQSGNEQVAQQAEQALNNLTGQQLLNKFDAGANAQSFFFSLPLLLQNEVRSVKVYVNSRKDGERIDWENCSLYFLLETKKLGDIGILLNANERNLSITFRNDKADFAEKMEPFMKVAKERLEEIGYHVTGVNVTKLTKDIQMKESKPISQTPSYAIFTEKGYDFTI